MRGVQIFIIDEGRTELLLDEDFSVEESSENPVLVFSEIPGAFSIGVKIPVEGNETALKQSHHIETLDGDYLFDILYTKDGTEKFYGKMLVESSLYNSEKDYYDVMLIRGSLGASMVGEKLRSVISEDLDIYDGLDIYSAIKAINEQNFPDVPFCFPTYFNSRHFPSEAEHFDGWINPFNQSVQLFQQLESLQPGELYYRPNLTFSPELYLSWILNKVFDYFGYRIEGDFIDDTTAQKITVESNYSIEQFRDGYRAEFLTDTDRTLTNTFVPFDILADSTDDSGDVANDLQLYEVQRRGIIQISADINCGTYSGSPTIEIKTGFGPSDPGISFPLQGQNQVTSYSEEFTFDAADVGDYLFVRVVGADVNILTNTSVRFHHLTESSGFDFKRSINASNLVPDITVGKLINAVRKIGLHFRVDDLRKVVNIGFQNDSLSAPVVELKSADLQDPLEYNENKTFRVSLLNEEEPPELGKYIGEFDTYDDLGLARTGDVALIRSHGAYYIYEVNQTTDQFEWQFLAEEDKFRSIGTGDEEEISLDFGVTHSEVRTLFSDQVLVPVRSKTGSGEAYGLKLEKGELNFGFYHGLVNGSSGPYPMSTAFGRDIAGNTLGSFNFSLVQSDGFFERFWKPVLSKLSNTRTITKRVLDYDPRLELPYEVRVRYKDNDFLVAAATKVDTEFESPLELELIKI